MLKRLCVGAGLLAAVVAGSCRENSPRTAGREYVPGTNPILESVTPPQTRPPAGIKTTVRDDAGRAPTSQASTRPSAEPYLCQFTDEPITLDGNADEPAWKRAAVIDHFMIPVAGGTPRAPHGGTRAKLLWDREYLYFFAEMQDTDLYADVKEHQGQVWTNDAFELFFKPAEYKPGYYEFEVNPLNTTLELFLPMRNAGGYDRFKSETHIEMKTAVHLDGTLNHWQDTDKGWTVEGRIRWRDFSPTGGRPNVNEDWKFALCRVDYSFGIDSPELSSAAPLTQVNFHRYEDYSTIRFVGPSADAIAPARPYGIEKRVPWTTSHVVGYPDPPLPYTVARAYPNLSVRQPVYVLEEPGTDNLLILQHLGSWNGPSRLLRVKNSPDVRDTETLLDFDRLTLGMTLHPDFLHNGYIYFQSNGPISAANRQDRISRFTVDRKTGKIDPKSELVILEWDSNGHNGGDVAFGPDGYLYTATGDGSSDSDANIRGQDLTHLNSVMIRIDVDHPSDDKPYSIPSDNPFLSTPGARPEVWAYGFRNPWRMTFDAHTGQLWVGQNGQDAWEQAYAVHRGENYGWSVYEGSHPFNLQRKQGPTPITGPTVEHPHSEMRSLTGGVVYYGSKLPELNGAYIYGDWSTGRIWGVKYDGKQVTWHHELARTPLQITGFRELASGELLVIDHGGALYSLQPAPKDAVQPPFPRKLSETGLFASTADHTPAPGLIPYDVNAPLWSDGALKERFIALPNETTIDVAPTRGWNFPEGAVLVKTFSLQMEPGRPARRVETRLLTKQGGQWAGYSYVWNDEQTDASLVEAAGADRDYVLHDAAGQTRTQTWHYPSRAECMTCHTRASNFVLGPSVLQFNKDHDYGDGRIDNQLRTLEHLGVLRVDYMGFVRDRVNQEQIAAGKSDQEAGNLMWQLTDGTGQREVKPGSNALLAFDPQDTARLVNPSDGTKDLTSRVRSYLHANCAICHVDAGGGNSLMNLEWGVSDAKMRIFDQPPQHETFGLPDPRLISPGHPDSSVLLHRLQIKGTGQMPPLATREQDREAIRLLQEWIEKMPKAAQARK